MKKNAIFIVGIAFIALITFLFFNSSQTTEEPKISLFEGDVYERVYSPVIGPENAPVTIVEFFDPACEACRAFYPYVKEILNRYPNDVRLVLRYAAYHEGSDTVVQMLETARLQNLFVPLLEALLKDQNEWASHHNPDIDRAWELAEATGLDIQQAKEFIKSGKFDSLLKQESEDIRFLRVNQTPTFFVNKKPLESFGFDQLYSLVQEEIESNKLAP